MSYSKLEEQIKNMAITGIEPESLVDEDSLTVNSRIKPPNEYVRVLPSENSFSSYINSYKLKPSVAPTY